MENTNIVCCGAMKERRQDIEDTFDWQTIAAEAPCLMQASSNPEIFEATVDGKPIGALSLHRRYFCMHPFEAPLIRQVLPILEDTISRMLDCKCIIRADLETLPKTFTVYLYSSENRSFCGLREGDLLTFGSFSQQGPIKARPVRWRILELGAEDALLISEKALMTSGYCDGKAAYGNHWCLPYGNSLARYMCNGVFYGQAFTWEEKRLILPQQIDEVRDGPICTDPVFLLSEEQVRLYFRDETDRRAMPTVDLLEQATQSPEMRLCNGFGPDKDYVAWWLLPQENDAGPTNGFSVYPKEVLPDGKIQYHGRNIYHQDFTIRPCIRVRLNDEFKAIIQKNQEAEKSAQEKEKKAQETARSTQEPARNTQASAKHAQESVISPQKDAFSDQARPEVKLNPVLLDEIQDITPPALAASEKATPSASSTATTPTTPMAITQASSGNSACLGRLKEERAVYAGFLAEKASRAFLTCKPNQIFSLDDVLNTVSEIAGQLEHSIPPQKIKDFLFRQGFLRMAPCKALFRSGTYVRGEKCFANPPKFGSPDGRPIMTPPQRPIFTASLRDLFAEELASSRYQRLDGGAILISSSLFLSFLDRAGGDGYICSFDFETSDDSHYTVQRESINVLTAFLRKEIGAEETALSLLTARWAEKVLQSSCNLEHELIGLLKRAGVPFQQYHF